MNSQPPKPTLTPAKSQNAGKRNFSQLTKDSLTRDPKRTVIETDSVTDSLSRISISYSHSPTPPSMELAVKFLEKKIRKTYYYFDGLGI